MTAPEENVEEVPEVPISVSVVTIMPPETEFSIDTRLEQELVLPAVEPETTLYNADDNDIVDEPAPRAGLVKRWTQKIVAWVKRVFNWRKA